MQRYIDTDFISISGVSGMCWMDGDLCQGAGTGVAVRGVPALPLCKAG